MAEALPLEGCESPTNEPAPVVGVQTAEEASGLWGEEERKLIDTGWKQMVRGGLVIWANLETDFYFSQEVALHLRELRGDAP